MFISNITIVFQKFCPKYPDKELLTLDLRVFIFSQNVALRKIKNDFKCDYTFFEIQQEIPK